MPELRRLIVAGDPSAWTRAGFAVDGETTVIGSVSVRLVPGDGGVGPGVIGWELAPVDGGPSTGPDLVDGISTSWIDEPVPAPVQHPNGVSRLDHVVVRTPDLARTVTALEGAGFETRRTRLVPGTEPAISQVFLWAGEAILEVVGRSAPAPDDPEVDRPATIWGLALTTDDLDGAVRLLSPSITEPKPAVQPGRRIATIDTAALGVGPALAVMSPHPGRSRPGPGDE